MLLATIVVLTLGDVVDPSANGHYFVSGGPWAFRWNPAGLMRNEVRQLLVSNILRFGSSNMRGFSVALVQPAVDSFAGVIEFSSDFSDLGTERLSFVYGFAGKSGDVDLGLNLGVEKIDDDDFSIFLDVGATGRFSGLEYVYYSVAVRNFRVYSTLSDLTNLADVGGGILIDYDQMKFSANVGYLSNEIWDFTGGAEVSVDPISLYVTVPYMYSTLTEQSTVFIDAGGTVNIGNFTIGASVLYPFGAKQESSDPFSELSYDFHIDIRIGVKW